mmetsp:Transcript_4752/g.9420  ORF Transcript_4752/g.9420 Transcript_4752/m.9420 type:complete len:265 (-) Transcript_4752:2431-3225(-)
MPTARAHTILPVVVAHRGIVEPAPLALEPLCLLDANNDAALRLDLAIGNNALLRACLLHSLRRVHQLDLRSYKDEANIIGDSDGRGVLKNRILAHRVTQVLFDLFVFAVDHYLGLHVGPHHAPPAGSIHSKVDIIANLADFGPFFSLKRLVGKCRPSELENRLLLDLPRDVLPCVFSHMRHDGCNAGHEHLKRNLEHRLAGAARRVIRRGDVESVFCNVEIEVGEVANHKYVHGLGCTEELVLIISILNLFLYFGQLAEHVLVD